MAGRLIRRAFLLLVFFLWVRTGYCGDFYLPFREPGAIGYFRIEKSFASAKVTVSFGKRKYTFPAISRKAYFVLPYESRGKKVKISLIVDGREAIRKYIRVIRKKFPVSRIRVKERKMTKELLKRIERERRLLSSIFSRVTPRKFKSSRMQKPLKKFKISTPFGAKRIINGKKRSVHWGIDIPAKAGTPVYCALSGRVVLARNLFFTGNTVIVDHGLGIFTLYAHLSEISVKENQTVKKGTVIGKVGSTGRSTGPHLHFGVYLCGVRADPLLVLKSRL